MTGNRADGEAVARPPEVGAGAPIPDTRPIVAFDFDGTLTVRDSFNAFLAWRAGPMRLALGLIMITPAMVRYLVRRDRRRLKSAAVRVFLRGVGRADLAGEAAAFAQHASSRLLRPDALMRWMEHRRAGARLVIVTASPDILVAPFAERLGAAALLGTRLAFNDADQVVGALDGPNCRGEEKVRRLRQAFGEAVRLQAAYGDTAGDVEMLGLADQPGMRVFTGRPGA